VPGQRQKARRDGNTWLVGTEDDVAWINAGVTRGMSITASIPPVFAAYATLAFPLDLDAPRELLRPREDRFDDTLLRVLSAHTDSQPWWLGFLETGASDVVLAQAPRVHVYNNWPYVLVQAGPQEARNWRSDEGRWHTALPELMFPADRSWLLASLWDDAWAGVGGSDDLISALLAEPDLSPEKTDPSVPDMWPSIMPEEMHDRLGR
jgi:hypothetical protein